MRLDFYGGIEPGSAVLHDDCGAGTRMPRPDTDMQRPGIGIHPMLYGVLHDGLQCQGRQAELGIRDIVFDSEHIVVLRLFHAQVGPGVLQFRRKGNGAVACDGVKIPAQIVGKIHRDLPGLCGICPAKAVNAHQGIVDEMRPHPQYHDFGALVGYLPLLSGDFLLLYGNFPLETQVLLDLIRQDNTVHGQSGDDVADADKGENLDKQLHDHRGRYRQDGDEESQKGFAGKQFPSPDCYRKIEKQDNDGRQQK